MKTLSRSLHTIFIVCCAIIGAGIFTLLGFFVILGHLASFLIKELKK